MPAGEMTPAHRLEAMIAAIDAALAENARTPFLPAVRVEILRGVATWAAGFAAAMRQAERPATDRDELRRWFLERFVH